MVNDSERPALRPGEGQYGCFLADRCVGDLRCQVDSAACKHHQTEATTFADLARGERVYIDKHGTRRVEPAD